MILDACVLVVSVGDFYDSVIVSEKEFDSFIDRIKKNVEIVSHKGKIASDFYLYEVYKTVSGIYIGEKVFKKDRGSYLWIKLVYMILVIVFVLLLR